MKRLVLCGLLMPSFALAQAPPQNPMEAAMASEIMECVSGKVQLRARNNALEAANAARPVQPPQPAETPK